MRIVVWQCVLVLVDCVYCLFLAKCICYNWVVCIFAFGLFIYVGFPVYFCWFDVCIEIV